MASGKDNDQLGAGPVSKVIMPITAIGIVLMLTVYVLYTELVLEETASDYQPPVAERALAFSDEDGKVVVRDGEDGEVLERIGEGEEAFMRQTVRQLAQARQRGGGAREEIPFILRGQEDGRLILEDPVTGQGVDLAAFGETNAQAFARFLEVEGGEDGAEDR